MPDFPPARPEPEYGDLERFTRKVAIVFLFVIGVVFLWYIKRILILLFVAGVLAAGIAPAVRRVRTLARLYTKRRIRRGTAVMLVYLPFVLTVVALVVFGLPMLLAESQQLATEIPRLLSERVLTPLQKYIPGLDASMLKNLRPQRPVLGYVRGAVGLVAAIVALLFLIGYMLMDSERLRNLFLLFYPAHKRSQKRSMVRRMSKRMSSWLSGQLLLAGIVGLATFVALLVLRIPYALPLAVFAAIGEMIPVLGPIIGAIPPLCVALFLTPWQFWGVLIMAILIQMLENHLLVPRLMGKKVSVSPLAIVTAFMIGGTLLGIIGAIMAIPAVAIIQVIFEEAFVKHRERRQNADRPGTLAQESVAEP